MSAELVKPTNLKYRNIFREKFVEEIKNNNTFDVGTRLDNEDLNREAKIQELQQNQDRFELEQEKNRLDIELKKNIFKRVFNYLAVEVLLIFIIVLLQGFDFFNFELRDTTINIFVTATIIQISTMAVIITRHLFPTDKQRES